MALFGLFGKEKSGPASSEFDEKGNKIQPNAQVNPEGGVDFVNNATVGASAPESAPIDPVAGVEANPVSEVPQAMQAEQPAVEVAANLEANPIGVSAVSEAAPVSVVDEAAVAANVDQQFANAGFEPSGQVVVQPEVAPVAVAEQAPAEPVALGTEQAANTAPEQPAQPGGEMPEAA